jgi:uncharacterized protein (DUF433 family)
MKGYPMYERIEIKPEILLGQPVIKGTRMPVHAIVEAIASGNSVDELLVAYPYLTKEDISQTLQYAAKLTQ